MKKLGLFIAIIASTTSLMAQAPAAGKVFMEGEAKGKKIQLGTDKSVDIVLANIKAYNLNDGSDVSQYVADSKPGSLQSLIKDWHKNMKSLNEVPLVVFPVKVQGEKNESVVVYANEDRVYKNGSTQKLSVVEFFEVTPEGKIASFNQFTQIPTTNEFGQTTGGKFFAPGNSKLDGTSFQFSNRGEVETMEKFMKAYNVMDVATCASLMADSVKIHDFDGNVMFLTKAMLPSVFGEYSSLDWQPLSMIPVKITDTDPSSAILVNATEKRVLKNGTVWEKDLLETFYINRAGKISEIYQYSRGLDKK
ncbi:MAG: hypothetical protein RLZ95_346 [Bacteroidota bacterium]|jgi:hypothetical protein